MKHLQFQRFNNILALSEPQNQLVTFLHASCGKSHSVIKICQLVCPLFPIIPFFQFLQNANPLFQTDILSFIELVLQNITPRVLRCYLYKLLIVINCLYKLFSFDAKLAEGVTDCSSPRSSLICQKQHIFCILIPPVRFIQITDNAEHHNALYPAPVYGISNFRCLYIIPLSNQFLNFIRSYFIFILIQGNSLPTSASFSKRQ